MADLQLPGPNHKEANCIPNELVRYSGVTRPLCGVTSQIKGRQHQTTYYS